MRPIAISGVESRASAPKLAAWALVLGLAGYLFFATLEPPKRKGK